MAGVRVATHRELPKHDHPGLRALHDPSEATKALVKRPRRWLESIAGRAMRGVMPRRRCACRFWREA